MAGSKEASSYSDGTICGSWIYNQHDKEYPYTNTGVGISWFPAEFPHHDNYPTGAQAACPGEDGETGHRPEKDDNTGTSILAGEMVAAHLAAPLHYRYPQRDRVGDRLQHEMVAGQFQLSQWETLADHTMGPNNRVRCVQDRRQVGEPVARG